MESIMDGASKTIGLLTGLLYNRKVTRIVIYTTSILALCYFFVFSFINKNASSLVLFILFGGLGLTILRKNKPYVRIFALVYFSSVITMIALYHIYMARYGTPYYIGGSDDRMYETLANNLAARMGLWDLKEVNSILLTPAKDYFAYIYSLVLITNFSNLLGGSTTFDFRLFNCLLNALCGLMLYRLCTKHVVLSEKTSFLTTILCCCAPFFLYITANLFRDTWIVFLILVVVWAGRELYLDSKYYLKMILWLLIAITLFVLYYSRMMVNWLMIFYITADVFYVYLMFPKEEKRKPQRRIVFYISATLGIALMVVLFSTGFFNTNRFITKIDHINDYYREYYQAQYTNIPESSHPPTETIPPNFADNGVRFSDKVIKMPLPQGLLLRYPMLLFTPLPRFSNLWIEDIFIKIGTCIRFFIAPYILYGAIRSFITRKNADIACLFVVMFLIIGATTFTFRHIIMMYPFAAITAARGYVLLDKKIKIKRTFFWCSLGVLLLYQLSNLVL